MSTGDAHLSKTELAQERRARAAANKKKKQKERMHQQFRNCRCKHPCCRLPNRRKCCKYSYGCPCFGVESIPCSDTCVCAIHIASAAPPTTHALGAMDTSADPN